MPDEVEASDPVPVGEPTPAEDVAGLGCRVGAYVPRPVVSRPTPAADVAKLGCRTGPVREP
jgi:hypothetical protein